MEFTGKVEATAKGIMMTFIWASFPRCMSKLPDIGCSTQRCSMAKGLKKEKRYGWITIEKFNNGYQSVPHNYVQCRGHLEYYKDGWGCVNGACTEPTTFTFAVKQDRRRLAYQP